MLQVLDYLRRDRRQYVCRRSEADSPEAVDYAIAIDNADKDDSKAALQAAGDMLRERVANCAGLCGNVCSALGGSALDKALEFGAQTCGREDLP